MREIKFRALVGGQWFYGDILNWAGEAQIWADGHNFIVKNKETIGQYTGLKDKNGVEIYEGDVLVSTFGNGLPFVIKFGEYHDSSGDDDLATAIGFYILEQDGTESLFGKSVNGDTDCYQVIGNVFQNLSTNHL